MSDDSDRAKGGEKINTRIVESSSASSISIEKIKSFIATCEAASGGSLLMIYMPNLSIIYSFAHTPLDPRLTPSAL